MHEVGVDDREEHEVAQVMHEVPRGQMHVGPKTQDASKTIRGAQAARGDGLVASSLGDDARKELPVLA